MSWLAVNKGGVEIISEHKPFRSELYNGIWEVEREFYEKGVLIKLKKGSIEKLIGKKLTWKDEPIRY